MPGLRAEVDQLRRVEQQLDEMRRQVQQHGGVVEALRQERTVTLAENERLNAVIRQLQR